MHSGRRWTKIGKHMAVIQSDIKGQTSWTSAMRTNGGGVNEVGGGAEPFKIGRAWRSEEKVGSNTEMGWRNVTHAVDELPVCLPKWRLRENTLVRCHLVGIANAPPSAACSTSQMNSGSVWSGLEEDPSPEADLAPLPQPHFLQHS